MINIKYANGIFQMCENGEVVDTFDTVGVLYDHEGGVLLKWGDYNKVNAYAEIYRNCTEHLPCMRHITLIEFSAQTVGTTDEQCQRFCDALNHSIECSGSVVKQFEKFYSEWDKQKAGREISF